MKLHNLKDILFLDIETVPQHPDFENVSESMQKHWDKKSSFFRAENETASEVYQRAGIYAEFGKIICISAGLILDNTIKVKSFAGDDEKELLLSFANMLNDWDKTGNKKLCGHNIKEFDVPYIARRMLINQIELPKTIDIAGKKPWEVNHIDTMDLWKFGDYKHYTSLSLLADVFNIPTPKDDIDGSQVYEVYYKENNLKRITTYCEKDVLCVANLFLKFHQKEIIPIENMIVV